jgi:hypothetical protein
MDEPPETIVPRLDHPGEIIERGAPLDRNRLDGGKLEPPPGGTREGQGRHGL